MVLEAERNCERYAEGTNLITTVRMDGYDMVYCLKIFSVRTGVGL
jgi:hypothetical protein